MTLLSSIAGGSGVPTITFNTPKTLLPLGGYPSDNNLQIAFTATGVSLTPILNITVPGIISFLAFTAKNLTSTIDQIKVTVDGVVWIDQSAVVIGANTSHFAIGGALAMTNSAAVTGNNIIPDRRSFKTLKIEVDTTTAGNGLFTVGNPEVTQ